MMTIGAESVESGAIFLDCTDSSALSEVIVAGDIGAGDIEAEDAGAGNEGAGDAGAGDTGIEDAGVGFSGSAACSIISKSAFPTPQSGQHQSSGTSAHFVPAGIPSSGNPFASS